VAIDEGVSVGLDFDAARHGRGAEGFQAEGEGAFDGGNVLGVSPADGVIPAVGGFGDAEPVAGGGVAPDEAGGDAANKPVFWLVFQPGLPGFKALCARHKTKARTHSHRTGHREAPYTTSHEPRQVARNSGLVCEIRGFGSGRVPQNGTGSLYWIFWRKASFL
jgi:hypothetical protein